MFGATPFRRFYDMASQAVGSQPLSPSVPQLQPTKYYFAYGSNLHLRQMKRRCPNSKFIGCARLSNYRWQINERGYANVLEAEGHWVDGLVYEIDQRDEAKLDINEGVSKNAYAKRYMPVFLRRAHSALYRRPTSWIVDKGGPTRAMRQMKQEGIKLSEYPQHWQQDVLVYISLNFIQDSDPKDEYVNRINLGLNDARALGIEDDYIKNCIRPYIPEPEKASGVASGNEKGKRPARGVKRSAPQRVAERSPARKQVPTQPEEQTPQETHQPVLGNMLLKPYFEERRAVSDVGAPPPLPPRTAYRARSIPAFLVEELRTSIYRSTQ